MNRVLVHLRQVLAWAYTGGAAGRPPNGRARVWTTRVGAAAAAVLLVAACGSSSSGNTGSTKTGGTFTFAMDEDIAGLNVQSATGNEEVTGEMLEQVWPTVFYVHPDLKPHLNTSVVTSAKLTSSNPQTVVYQINPKATWSDGTPINADDFIYNWQAQSGDPQFTDVGGKPFEPAGTTGYSSIKSVTGSNGGKTVTVVFSEPFGDWQSLFSEMIPAHLSKKVGFNDGWADFGPDWQVSGGPFMIQSYTKGQDLVEVPNPQYWGKKPSLSKLVFRFILDDSQQPAAAQNGEVQLVSPTLATVEFLDSLKNVPNFTSKTQASLSFQHLDFNEANAYLSNPDVRHAIAYGTDRNTITQRTADLIDKSIKPLGNRVYMPSQPQYQNTSGSYGNFDPAKAKQLLQGAGMTMGSDGYFQPNSGPQKGQDLTFTISTTSGQPTRTQIEQLFQSEMKNIGVKINVQNYPASTLFGTVLPKGEFDISLFAWVQSPFASGT
ncbi:MAG: ABC transporter family substrate-binding protein, partial [Candidatus Dormibacteraeota bacterium]|nr:ABC transporter family substrate-binding protein [Candidatus Dormibacteraeota bacterium]